MHVNKASAIIGPQCRITYYNSHKCNWTSSYLTLFDIPLMSNSFGSCTARSIAFERAWSPKGSFQDLTDGLSAKIQQMVTSQMQLHKKWITENLLCIFFQVRIKDQCQFWILVWACAEFKQLLELRLRPMVKISSKMWCVATKDEWGNFTLNVQDHWGPLLVDLVNKLVDLCQPAIEMRTRHQKNLPHPWSDSCFAASAEIWWVLCHRAQQQCPPQAFGLIEIFCCYLHSYLATPIIANLCWYTHTHSRGQNGQ